VDLYLPKVDIVMMHLKMLAMHVFPAIDVVVLLLIVVDVVVVVLVLVVVMIPVVQMVVVSNTDQRTEVDCLKNIRISFSGTLRN